MNCFMDFKGYIPSNRDTYLSLNFLIGVLELPVHEKVYGV